MKAVKIVEIHGDKMKYIQHLLPLHYQKNDNEIILAAVDTEGSNEAIVCGVLVVQMNEFSSEVTHIEIEKTFRREHIATQLLNYFIDLQFQIGEVWPITITYVDGFENQELVAFIENREDFDIQYDCMIYHVQAHERELSESWQKLRTLKKQAELFMDLPKNMQERFRYKIESKGIPYLQNMNFEKLEPSLCYYIQKNNEIVAVLLIQAENDQELEVVFVYADPNHQLELAIATASAIKAVEKKYPEAVVTIVAAEVKADVFARHMFPQCMNKEAIFRAVWNYKRAEGEENYVWESRT